MKRQKLELSLTSPESVKPAPQKLEVRLRLEVRALTFIILASWRSDQPFGASDPTDHENPYEQYRHPLHPTLHSALARRA